MCFVRVDSWYMNERYVSEEVRGFSQWEEGKYAMPDREVAVGAGRITFSAYSDAA